MATPPAPGDARRGGSPKGSSADPSTDRARRVSDDRGGADGASATRSTSGSTSSRTGAGARTRPATASGSGSGSGTKAARGPTPGSTAARRPSTGPTDRTRPPSGSPRKRPADASAPRPGRPAPVDEAEHRYVEDPPLGESSWRSFFRPVSSSRPGTMPAGMVLAVIVSAMVIALFMSGTAINRKSAGRPHNSDWRRTTAEALASVSGLFHLDAPSNAVEDAVAPAMGREQRTTGENNLDELLAAKAAEEGTTSTTDASTTAPVTEPGASVPDQVTTTTVDPGPKVRTPTPDQPLKLWVGGDSISYDYGIAIENIALDSKLFNVTRDSRASTGLSRPDYFNWPEHLVRNVITEQDPDVIMVMFGANDAQNIPMPPPIGGYVLGSAEWQAEYRDRVGKTMDLLRSPNNDRLVMWVGQPIMGPSSGVEHLDQINYIYYSEAQKRPWVKYFDAYPFFSDASGAYAKSLPNADGAEHVMRANDNIHLSTYGADRLAWAVMVRLGTILDLSKGQVVPDPAEMPPTDIAERTEIPPGDGQAPSP